MDESLRVTLQISARSSAPDVAHRARPTFPANFLSTTNVPLTFLLTEPRAFWRAVPPDPDHGTA